MAMERTEISNRPTADNPTPKAIADEAAPLTEYAWRFRYPGEIAEPERAEAEQALDTARCARRCWAAFRPTRGHDNALGKTVRRTEAVFSFRDDDR